jgi:hypothetical protein
VVSRLNEVIPPRVSVRANGVAVDVYGERGNRAASGAGVIVGDDDGRSLEERVEIAARSILNGAQDAIMELLREQWPLGPNGKAAYSDARVIKGQLRMWYGEEDAPVLVLAPVPIDEIFEGAA